MNSFLIFILGVAVGVVGVKAIWFFSRKKGKGSGGEELIEKQKREKEENMAKVLSYFSGREKVSNNDIENLLSVSDATATRYLDELEKKGQIRQVGKAGKYVYYEKVR